MPRLFLNIAACVLLTVCVSSCPPSAPEHEPGETAMYANILFQWVPPGSFWMGSPGDPLIPGDEDTRHWVTIRHGFWMSRWEMTQNKWNLVMPSNPSLVVGNTMPMHNVTWYEVQEFLDAMHSAYPDLAFRLPTEAEWEYACRAGSTTRFYWGDELDVDTLNLYMWWYGNSDLVIRQVGNRTANDWGLQDMLGNAQEWCQDWYGEYPELPQTDPQGPATGTQKVLRGGAYHGLWDNNTCARRDKYRPDWRASYYGFRVIVEEL